VADRIDELQQHNTYDKTHPESKLKNQSEQNYQRIMPW
jgi:hypothetical protein